MSPPPRAYQRSELEALLSSALGLAQARQVVADTFLALRLGSEQFDDAVARRVLARIAASEGLVGIAGRIALTRLDGGARSASGTMQAPARSIKRSLVLVSSLLAPTLGEERAETLVRDLARSLALGDEIELDQALMLLEKVAQMPGVTGIAARFAKTRIHLSW